MKVHADKEDNWCSTRNYYGNIWRWGNGVVDFNCRCSLHPLPMER